MMSNNVHYRKCQMFLMRLMVLLPCFIAHLAQAQTIDRRAQDAVALFMSHCVSTGGASDKAFATLSNSKLANRLPDDKLQQLHGGRADGVAWVVRSPRDALLLLEFEPRGICGVRIAEADELSVQKTFEVAVQKFADQQKGTLVKRTPEMKMANDVPRTFLYWTLQVEGQRKTALALSTTPRRQGETQHMMTFNYTQ